MNTNCTWCRFLESLHAQDLQEELKQYIESLPQSLRVSDEVHHTRLSLCDACEDCISGLCRYCGCFVVARTAKSSISCPKPQGAKWMAETVQSHMERMPEIHL